MVLERGTWLRFSVAESRNLRCVLLTSKVVSQEGMVGRRGNRAGQKPAHLLDPFLGLCKEESVSKSQVAGARGGGRTFLLKAARSWL